MSIQAVAWVLEQTIPDQGAKLVLISLANAHNARSGRCYPSIEQIMVEASCSRATVKRKLGWLADNGWIKTQEAFDQTGRQLANSYTIQFTSGLEGGVQGEPVGGLNLNPRGITTEPPGGLNCEPPLKEPEEIPEEDILSETSSDQARKPKKRNSYSEVFEAFWKTYPTSPNMAKKEAFDAWAKLDAEERAACAASIPGYLAFLHSKPGHEVIHACRFISKRRFEGFAAGSASPVAAADDGKWPGRLKLARERKTWSTPQWGPRPGLAGCRVPPSLLLLDDGAEWREWENGA